MKRYAHATRAFVESVIAEHTIGELTTLKAADKMRMNGVAIHVALRTLARVKRPRNPHTVRVTNAVIDAIHKTLDDAMDQAVKNGRMPDEYVTVAAWLYGITK